MSLALIVDVHLSVNDSDYLVLITVINFMFINELIRSLMLISMASISCWWYHTKKLYTKSQIAQSSSFYHTFIVLDVNLLSILNGVKLINTYDRIVMSTEFY